MEKPSLQLRRRLDVLRQSLDSVRQGRIASLRRDLGPVHGRRRIHRSLEIVAKGRTERLFVAFFDRDVIDNRRPEAARFERQHFGKSFCLGLEALHALFRFSRCRARRLHLGTGDVVRRFCGDGRCFRLGQRRLRALKDSVDWTEICGLQRCQLAFDCLDFG